MRRMPSNSRGGAAASKASWGAGAGRAMRYDCSFEKLSEMEALAAESRRGFVEFTISAKEHVIVEQPVAHAVFHEAVTEERMQCPATCAIYADAERKIALARDRPRTRRSTGSRKAADLAAAAESGEDAQLAEIRKPCRESTTLVQDLGHGRLSDPPVAEIRSWNGSGRICGASAALVSQRPRQANLPHGIMVITHYHSPRRMS